jgi:DNA-binding transcriptional ArsR family regulator
MDRTRDLTGDPTAMLALAHPTRLSLLELLGREGPLTATQAGTLLGESPGTMSWHLRMLARHGFVTEAEGARGRRQPWMLTAMGTSWDPEPQSEAGRAADETLSMVVVERVFGQLRAWIASRYAAPRAWQRAADVSDWTLYLTAAETEQLRDQIHRLFGQFTDRIEHPAQRPAAAVAVRAFITLHPQSLPSPGDEE